MLPGSGNGGITLAQLASAGNISMLVLVRLVNPPLMMSPAIGMLYEKQWKIELIRTVL